MAYLEKDFQTDFNKWCKYIYRRTAAFELKLTKAKSLPFSAVKEHQENALFRVKHNGLIHKIPDAGFQNPFDSFMLFAENAYVVIMFEAKNTDFVMIDIDTWIQEKQRAHRASLTADRAGEIGQVCSLGLQQPLPQSLRTEITATR